MKMKPYDRIRRKVMALKIAEVLAGHQISKTHNVTVGNRSWKAKATELPLSEWNAIDMDTLLMSDEEWGVFADATPRDYWPANGAIITSMDEKDFSNLSRLRMMNWTSGGPRDFRKSQPQPQRFSPYMIQIHSQDFIDGAFMNQGSVTASYLGGKWVDAVVRMGEGPTWAMSIRGSDIQDNCAIAIGISLRWRYEWSAVFHFPNQVSLRFGTDARGVLSLFKDRDKFVQETRRSPLLHWVRRHWRVLSRADNEEVSREIRKHLRGKETLRWYGMNVTIVPSEYEVEMASRQNA